MADIRLSNEETALWKEVGSRGDAFREATRARGFEQARLSGKMTEIIDYQEAMVDSISAHEPVP
ncbi:MAG TPA: hypothetical protein PLA87_21165 [Pseudomonadota bacterium]|jgi:hypothetical protein|nr:hypothetical protein [Pseudomonadota bacterium]